jgi:hypothetical protein
VVTLAWGLMLTKGTPAVARGFAGPDIPPILYLL